MSSVTDNSFEVVSFVSRYSGFVPLGVWMDFSKLRLLFAETHPSSPPRLEVRLNSFEKSIQTPKGTNPEYGGFIFVSYLPDCILRMSCESSQQSDDTNDFFNFRLLLAFHWPKLLLRQPKYNYDFYLQKLILPHLPDIIDVVPIIVFIELELFGGFIFVSYLPDCILRMSEAQQLREIHPNTQRHKP